MRIECFSQRLLNPYRGTMHTVKYASAEAVTLDGVHWDIYVANDALLAGLKVSRHTQISDIRYGSWSAHKGLKRGPLYPSDDFKRLEEMGAVVYEHLLELHRDVPFPAQDTYELWLLDTTGAPLALLASAMDESQLDLDIAPHWRAGYLAAERFTSAAAHAMALDEPAADYLTRYVNAQAGPIPAAQWFWRDEERAGYGLVGINLPARWHARVLGAEAFPPTLLAVSAPDAPHRQLIAEFQAWQAPWLLMLPDLEPGLRKTLEQHARTQAALVLKHHRLYPETVDAVSIKAALVEAVMRQSAPEPASRPDPTLSTFYIELESPAPDWDRGK